MATLIKNHTTNQWEKVNYDRGTCSGFTGRLIEFAGLAENFKHPGWLLCDGTEYNVSDYPALYSVIGNLYGGTAGSTFCVPDYRETVKVGAGQNTKQSLIATHDVYDVGQFKDDQEQRVIGTLHTGNYWIGIGNDNNTSGTFYAYNGHKDFIKPSSTGAGRQTLYDPAFDNARVARTGTTTHGKQIGVSTFIHV